MDEDGRNEFGWLHGNRDDASPRLSHTVLKEELRAARSFGDGSVSAVREAGIIASVGARRDCGEFSDETFSGSLTEPARDTLLYHAREDAAIGVILSSKVLQAIHHLQIIAGATFVVALLILWRIW